MQAGFDGGGVGGGNVGDDLLLDLTGQEAVVNPARDGAAEGAGNDQGQQAADQPDNGFDEAAAIADEDRQNKN